MDRAIPVSEQRRRKLRRIAVAVVIAIAVLGAGAWLGTQMIPTLDRKALIISEVDRGTIDVSVSATGRIVPAFEEVIVSPISSKILEVYAHSGDSVDVGTPLLRLDLQSAETDYSKALDEREIRRQQTAQLKANVETQLSDRRMQIEVKEMELSQLEAQLRNELYLDSLGSGTRDRVRQAETTLKPPRCNFHNCANSTRTSSACARPTCVCSSCRTASSRRDSTRSAAPSTMPRYARRAAPR